MNLEKFLETQGWTQQDLANKLNEDSQRYGLPKTATQGAISQWVVKGKIPAERLQQLLRVSGGVLRPEILRPDLYPSDAA